MEGPSSTAGEAWLSWAVVAVLAVAGGALVWWSWMVWVDPVVDVGRELYVAWRLSEGDVLYRDVAYFNGPLSPYVNAAWFRLVGPSVRALLVINACVAVLTLAILYRMALRLSTPATATLVCLVLMASVMVLPRTPEGAYTFLAPYSHEMTHGLLLILAAMWTMVRADDSGSRALYALGGAFVGATLLTKPEIALTGCVVAAAAVWCAFRPGSRQPNQRGVLMSILVGVGVILIAAVALLAISMGPVGSLHAVSAPYVAALNGEVRSLPFYRWLSGTDDLSRSVKQILLGSLLYVVIFGAPFLALSAASPKTAAQRVMTHTGVILLGAVVVFGSLTLVPLSDMLAPVPVLLAVVLLGEASGRLPVLSRGRPGSYTTAVLLSGAGLALLLKIGLAVHLYMYGFVLASLSLCALLILIHDSAPQELRKRSASSAAVYRSYATAIILTFTTAHVVAATPHVAARTFEVGRGFDRFMTDPARGQVLSDLLLVLENRSITTGAFATMPEAAMLNYLTRTPRPIKYPTLLPPEQVIFGEEQILAELREARPTSIVFWERRLPLYGTFGSDYARESFDWIMSRYAPVWQASYEQPGLVPPDSVRVRLLSRSSDVENQP